MRLEAGKWRRPKPSRREIGPICGPKAADATMFAAIVELGPRPVPLHDIELANNTDAPVSTSPEKARRP
jgi:hypothetical protein